MQEISLNILDIAQNSVAAKARVVAVTVDERTAEDRLTVEIRDDGAGMTPEQVARVTDPFYTTRKTRRVGLGVPFFKMAAELSGGSFDIRSQKGVGTTVTAEFVLGSIDRMPLGDVNQTVSTLIFCNPDIDFVYTRRKDGREFTLDTRELRGVLAGVPLNNPEVGGWIREYLGENEEAVCGAGA